MFVKAMLTRQNEIIRETGSPEMEDFRVEMREMLDDYAGTKNKIAATFYKVWERL